MAPKLNGFRLLEEIDETYVDPSQEEFDWSTVDKDRYSDEEEDESN